MISEKSSPGGKRYRSFDSYMKETFGKKGVRAALDGGFGCPNRDADGNGGCIYCSSRHYGIHGLSLSEQYDIQRAKLMKKWGSDVIWLPYLQSGCSTFSDIGTLERIYSEALDLPGAGGLIVATRADCVTDETADLLKRINSSHFLIVELGMQTAHDRTLKLINRRETHEDFIRGYKKLAGIKTVIHIIDGLPGEDEDDMLSTADELASLSPFGVKIHMLHVLKDTKLASMYLGGEFDLPDEKTYVSTVVSQLRRLPAETVICRLTGDGWSDELIAPDWTRNKFRVLNDIDAEMRRLGCRQGDMCGVTPAGAGN